MEKVCNPFYGDGENESLADFYVFGRSSQS